MTLGWRGVGMSPEESLRLARQHIAFIEGQLEEAESRYDRMAVEAFKYRNDAKRLEYAVRDHQRACLKAPELWHVANGFLWGVLDGK